MKNSKRTVLRIALLGLLIGAFSGCSAFEIKDGDGMINPYGPMLEALSGRWENEEGDWRAVIDGYGLTLLYGGDTVLEDSYTLALPDEDTEKITELELSQRELKCDKGAVGTAESLYSENGVLYLEISYPDGSSGTIRFEKKDR